MLPGRCWAVGNQWDMAPGVGEHRLRCGTAEAGPARRPGPPGSQALRHPAVAGCLKRAENRVWACGSGSGRGVKGKGQEERSLAGSHWEESPWFTWVGD